jgi:hypothetical protein
MNTADSTQSQEIGQMSFRLTVEDFTIIQNALHYYKKVDKRGNFQAYDELRVNSLRDKLANQLMNQDGDLSSSK